MKPTLHTDDGFAEEFADDKPALVPFYAGLREARQFAIAYKAFVFDLFGIFAKAGA